MTLTVLVAANLTAVVILTTLGGQIIGRLDHIEDALAARGITITHVPVRQQLRNWATWLRAWLRMPPGEQPAEVAPTTAEQRRIAWVESEIDRIRTQTAERVAAGGQR